MGWVFEGEARIVPVATAQPQCTLAEPVPFAGRGLHSGLEADFLVSPAPVDYGIRFDFEPFSPATPPTRFACFGDFTTSALAGDSRIKCVEHLMASFNGLGITNAHVQCRAGDEFPLLDGSARDMCAAFREAGIERQPAPVRAAGIAGSFAISDSSGGCSIRCSPADTLTVEADFDYPHVIGRQRHRFDRVPGAFVDEIAAARTFLKDPVDVVPVEQVRRERLLGLGEKPELITYTRQSILTELRYPNEPARHKILDFLGDIYTLGCPVQGRFHLVRSGHAISLALVEWLRSSLGPSEATGGDFRPVTGVA